MASAHTRRLKRSGEVRLTTEETAGKKKDEGISKAHEVISHLCTEASRPERAREFSRLQETLQLCLPDTEAPHLTHKRNHEFQFLLEILRDVEGTREKLLIKQGDQEKC